MEIPARATEISSVISVRTGDRSPIALQIPERITVAHPTPIFVSPATTKRALSASSGYRYVMPTTVRRSWTGRRVRPPTILAASLLLLLGLSANIAVAWAAARTASIKDINELGSGIRVVHRTHQAGSGYAGDYLGAGLPLPSLKWPVSKVHHMNVEGRSAWTAGIRLDALASWKALPVDPLWPGLIVNSVFYAALAFALWHIPRAMWRLQRQEARRSLGQCAACGYSQAGLPPTSACPECGTRMNVQSD